MVDFQLKQQWKQSITYAPNEGVSKSGALVFGSPRIMENVRIEPTNTISNREYGQEKTETLTIFSEQKIPFNALIWLGNEDSTRQDFGRVILRSEEFFDEFGNTSYFETGV